ncbi:MAG: hypothetical protein DRR16_09765 [Candidatus Parabeggiatoa sp. nov. 3]|nr:MAG: hypothetical protein DRR00_15345 [Gammaproteobacteria bacterium]RKZ86409.1 MAG: hypothetical protein DRR16_09765 [Gammaproteobacteria bacterium]HEW98349.1 GGDEF domain-containing response regulator [Beggiatoa sp.]
MMTSNSAHILVVDDAPLTRGLLQQALLKYGYSVETAQNGQQAIDSFLAHHPDLILMDANMPVLDGISACARIKALPEAKYLPILIVTALMEREWVDRAYAAGATDYITKPVNLDVLRNRIHYILQAKRAEEALFDEKEKAQVTLTSICDGVITTNAEGLVEFLNPVATNLTGWTTQAAQGLPLNTVFCIIDEKTQQPVDVPMECCLEEGKRIKIDNPVLVHRDRINRFAIEDSGAPIRDRHGKVIGAVLVFNDVTEKRKMTQALAYRATHDALTGLYNRDEFNLQLELMLQEAPRDNNTEHALLYMDLDQFKIVNDTCGHEAGDQLLKDVSFLMKKKIEAHTCFKQTTLARLGGDEFALLLKNCSQQKALTLAHHLREAIEEYRFFWENAQNEQSLFTIGISIGLVPILTQQINSKSLIAMADTACYTAKNKGRNTVHIYQENDSEASHKNIKWVTLLNENLEKKQGFYLFYQSIIALQQKNDFILAGNPKRCEILLRMKIDSQKQLVLPGAFLSAATRYHLMPTLDRWVIQTLLEWLKTQPKFLTQLTLCSINLSGYSLSSQTFLETVIDDIDNSNIPANKLCFEIQETTLRNLTDISYFMNALKKRGCRFAIDNFGSSIASFSAFKNIPIDFLKIDGRLINNITHDPVDYAMVKSINEIAHLMQIKTIAEHVENGITLEALKKIGLDYAQGYWIEEPQALQ